MEKLYFPEYEGFLENKEDDEIREFVEDSQYDSTKRKIGYWVDNLNMFAVNSGLHYPDILSKEGLNPVDWSPFQRYNTHDRITLTSTSGVAAINATFIFNITIQNVNVSSK